MDSVDWEAVRLADINDIAHIIRDRGMNNVIAVRIKVLLTFRKILICGIPNLQ